MKLTIDPIERIERPCVAASWAKAQGSHIPRLFSTYYLGTDGAFSLGPWFTSTEAILVMGITNAIGDWFQAILHEAWNWFAALNYQEWFVLLGIVAGFGFLCMRGFGTSDRV